MTSDIDMSTPGDDGSTDMSYADPSVLAAMASPPASSAAYADDPTDPYPPSQRPDWLKPFAHVSGMVSSAPLDMADRLHQVVANLEGQGWTTVVHSVGTDFEGPLGIPVPRDQPLDMLIHRTDRSYTLDEAQSALTNAIAAVSMNYSALGRWGSELNKYVAQPTIDDAKKAVKSNLPWIIGGGVLLLLVLLKLEK